jgi:threonyl-tRNA synthetase
LWDLERPLEFSCRLEFFDFEHPEGKLTLCIAIVDYISNVSGKRVFWHSSAHVLGEAAERHYGSHLCIGPPTEEGFFYEMAIENRPVTAADYPMLEKISDSAIKEKQKFERLMVPKETLLEMFAVSFALASTGSSTFLTTFCVV